MSADASRPTRGRAASSGAAPPARPWCGTPCATCSTSRAAPTGVRGRHRRRHRRVRGPGRRARPPGPRRRPQPRRPRHAGAPRRRERGRRPGHRTPGRPRRPRTTWSPAGSADVVLCHGVLEIVDDPAAALAALAGVLRPGGTLSLLVNQRHAAVVTRAMAGHFGAARALLDGPWPAAAAGARHRRFTADEIAAVLDAAGFDTRSMHAVRVFVDLVPSSLVDLEPGAAAGPGRARAGGRRPGPSTSPSPPRSTPWPPAADPAPDTPPGGAR